MFRRARLGRWAALAVPALASLLSIAQPAAAQPARPPEAPHPAPPPPLVVNDPMLAPVPPAPRTLASWREALAYITSRSVDVATAFQEIARAEGMRRQALANALPNITGTGTISQQLITGKGTDFTTGKEVSLPSTNPSLTASVTASLPIFAPASWYDIKTKDMSVTSSRLSYDDKRRTVLATVANAIISVITTERVAELNRTGLRTALERLELTRRQLRLGYGTRLDVLRVEQDAATARATLVSGDESMRQARESLGLALGFHEAFGVPPGLSLEDIQATVGGVCAPGKLDDRADIRQAKNDVEVAKRGITSAWLAFSPTASISSTVSVANQTLAADNKNVAWNLVATLNVPLWEGGYRYGTLRIAKASAEEAKLKLESTLRGANVAVAQALRGVAVAEQARAVSANARDLAKEAARLAQRAYEVGTGTSFDLVNTAQQERAAEIDLTVKEFQVISARLTAMLAAANCTY